MPKCNSCGKYYDDNSAIELVRNQDNRWVSLCRDCISHGVDVNLVEPSNIAVDEHALESSDSQVIDVTVSADPFENAKKLLLSLRNLRQSRERIGRARSHERKKIELTVNFTLARDDTRHEGTLKDFSQSGVRILTSQPLVKGQIVQFDWNMPLPPAMARMLHNQAEVRRAHKNDAGMYDIGLKFVVRTSEKSDNRRRFRRYKCDMTVFYGRDRSAFMSCGKVKDISQGGCQMFLDESLVAGEVFTARLMGGGGTRGDLVGSLRVCRVMPRELQFEIGCSFERMRIEAQPAPAAPKA